MAEASFPIPDFLPIFLPSLGTTRINGFTGLVELADIPLVDGPGFSGRQQKCCFHESIYEASSMIRLFWKGALATVLLTIAFGNNLAVAVPPTPSKKKSTTEAPTTGEVIVLKEQGKPDRKCILLSSIPRPDGAISHQVKAMDNGEIMTIVEPKSSATAASSSTTTTPTATAPAPVKSPNFVPEMQPVSSSKLPDPDAVPSALNPPMKPLNAMPKGAQFPPLDTPKGTATVSEPAPITAEPAMLPLHRVPAQVPATNPAQVSTVQPSAQIAQLKEMLTDALQPAHREIAAEGLCATSQGRSRNVRQLLLTSVQQDPAASVRLTCLRCLAKQNVMDEIFQTAMTSAQKDQDARVRNEAKAIAQQMSRR